MAQYTEALKGEAEATLTSGESFLGGLCAGLSSPTQALVLTLALAPAPTQPRA